MKRLMVIVAVLLFPAICQAAFTLEEANAFLAAVQKDLEGKAVAVPKTPGEIEAELTSQKTTDKVVYSDKVLFTWRQWERGLWKHRVEFTLYMDLGNTKLYHRRNIFTQQTKTPPELKVWK